MPAFVRRLTDRLPPRVRGTVQLAVATVRDAGEDRVPGLAAEMAFWVLLSLPPVLLTVTALAGVIGSQLGSDVQRQLLDRIEELSLQVFSADTVAETVSPLLEALLTQGSPSVLSLSFAATVFSASRVLRVVVLALTIAYDLEDAQPSWLTNVRGLVLTLAALVVGVVLIPPVVAGPRLGEIAERRLGLDVMLAEVYRVAYWPAALVVLTLLVAALYHFATPWRTPFHRELPGAVLATVLGLLAIVGLRTYTAVAIGGDAVYAPLAAPLALLVWLWLEGIALLMGAELNAEIEKAHPVGEPAPDAPSLAELGRRVVEKAPVSLPGSSGRAPDD